MVWVVVGESPQHRPGSGTAWVAGVGKTRAAAQVIAQEDAGEWTDDDEVVVIAGELYDDRRTSTSEPLDILKDWTVSYSITAYEVRFA